MSNLPLFRLVLLWYRHGRNVRCFSGYSGANYVLSEVRDPVRTIKRANPIALASVTVTYLLANVAYFGAISRKDILDSGRITA